MASGVVLVNGLPGSGETTLAAARAKGHLPGRKRIMTESKIASAKKLLAGGTPPADVAKDLGVSVPTLYRWVPARQQ